MNLETIRAQILSVSWCWMILTPCPIKLQIPFVGKCFMKTAFLLAAVSCRSPKNTLTYVFQQYEKNALRTSWLCCFCGWFFSIVQLWETTGIYRSHIQVAFLNIPWLNRKTRRPPGNLEDGGLGLFLRALMTSSNLTLQVSQGKKWAPGVGRVRTPLTRVTFHPVIR